MTQIQATPYKLRQLMVKLSDKGLKTAFYNLYSWKGEYFESIPYRSERDSLWGADLKYYKPYGKEKPANRERNNVEWIGLWNNSTGVLVPADKYVTRAYQGR